MKDKIKHFPLGVERQKRLNLRNYRVLCQVSERWLHFPKKASALSDGDYMVVDAMTMGSGDKERKLCELVLIKQDLLRMLQQIKTDKE